MTRIRAPRYVARPDARFRSALYPWPAIEATLRNGKAVIVQGDTSAFRNALYQHARRLGCRGHVRRERNGSALVWMTRVQKETSGNHA